MGGKMSKGMISFGQGNTKILKSKPKRTRRSNSNKSEQKICSNPECRQETRWLSVEGTCWKCTVEAAKNKGPLFLPQDLLEEEDEASLFGTD
jgi:hypothetical protein